MIQEPIPFVLLLFFRSKGARVSVPRTRDRRRLWALCHRAAAELGPQAQSLLFYLERARQPKGLPGSLRGKGSLKWCLWRARDVFDTPEEAFPILETL